MIKNVFIEKSEHAIKYRVFLWYGIADEIAVGLIKNIIPTVTFSYLPDIAQGYIFFYYRSRSYGGFVKRVLSTFLKKHTAEVLKA